MRLLSLIFFILLAGNAMAEPGVLTMTYHESFAPFSWYENGKMHGILVDVVQEVIGNRLGIAVSHNGYPWARAQYLVEHNRADGFVTVPTDARRRFAKVGSIPVVTSRMAMMTRIKHPHIADLEAIDDMEDLKPFKIGTHLGNGWARQNLSAFNVSYIPTTEQLMDMLFAGNIDIIVLGEMDLGYYAKTLGVSEKVVILPYKLMTVTLNLCINKQSAFADLPEAFDREMAKMIQTNELQKIYDRYR